MTILSIRENAIEQRIPQFGGALQALQGYSVLTQRNPLFDPTLANDPSLQKSIVKHQKDAKKLAKGFLNDLFHPQNGNLSDILEFSNRFKVFGGEIQKHLPNILQHPGDRDRVRKYLRKIRESSASVEKSLTEGARTMGSFQQKVQENYHDFSSDYKKIKRIYEDSGGTIDSLTKQIGALNQTISGDVTGIAISGITAALGVIIVTVGGLVSLESGSSATVVMTGVGLIVSGVGGVTTASIKLNNDNKKLAVLYQKLAKAKFELVEAQGAETKLASLQNRSLAASEACQTLKNAVSVTSEEVDQLKSRVDRAKTKAEVSGLMTSVNGSLRRWELIHDLTDTVQKRLGGERGETVKTVPWVIH